MWLRQNIWTANGGCHIGWFCVVDKIPLCRLDTNTHADPWQHVAVEVWGPIPTFGRLFINDCTCKGNKWFASHVLPINNTPLYDPRRWVSSTEIIADNVEIHLYKTRNTKKEIWKHSSGDYSFCDSRICTQFSGLNFSLLGDIWVKLKRCLPVAERSLLQISEHTMHSCTYNPSEGLLAFLGWCSK